MCLIYKQTFQNSKKKEIKMILQKIVFGEIIIGKIQYIEDFGFEIDQDIEIEESKYFLGDFNIDGCKIVLKDTINLLFKEISNKNKFQDKLLFTIVNDMYNKMQETEKDENIENALSIFPLIGISMLTDKEKEVITFYNELIVEIDNAKVKDDILAIMEKISMNENNKFLGV